MNKNKIIEKPMSKIILTVMAAVAGAGYLQPVYAKPFYVADKKPDISKQMTEHKAGCCCLTCSETNSQFHVKEP